MSETSPQPRAAPGRSCLACSKRKIRCNRGNPCSYCTKIRVQCVYPETAQEGKKQIESDFNSRLKRIEASLLRLESKISNVSDHQISNHVAQKSPAVSTIPNREDESSSSPADGRLIKGQGDGRYVTNSFWADIEESVDDTAADIEPLADISSSIHSTGLREPNQGIVFGLSSTSSDVHHLHPTESRVFSLWQVFLENVDPLLKIFHVPTTQRQILQATHGLDKIPPAFEGLMFSIYYASVTSLQCAHSCQKLMQEERESLMDRYRFALEQSLARANFMSHPNLVSLQALTLFLICARQACDKTYVWTMTGLAIRLATKLGLHRDPSVLGVAPFMAELRRRLWWQICILDVRTAEDNDMDPLICEHHFDTKFPSCVNDADLDVNMTQSAVSSNNRTEMMFCLTRFEISYAARKLVFSPKFTLDNGYANMSVCEKNNFIDSVQKNLEEQFLSQCDREIPICFLATIATRLVLAKLKLTINHPARTGSSGIPPDRLVDLIESSMEIVEYAHTLRTSEKYGRWVWLFQKYIEWDAVAFLLLSLNAGQVSSSIDRAWKAINCFFDDWNGHILEGERRWQRLESLRTKALARKSLNEDNILESSVTSTSTMTKSLDTTIKDPSEGLLANYPGSHHQQYGFQMPLTNLDEGFANNASYPFTEDANSNSIRTNHGLNQPSQDAETFLDWNFDNVPYVMNDSVSWEMDIDENAFNSWL